jgi:hypothetical protein
LNFACLPQAGILTSEMSLSLSNKKSNIEEIEKKIADSHHHHHGWIARFAIISPTDLFIRRPLIGCHGHHIR